VDPITKKILNNLKCPICGAPIDIYHSDEFSCAINNDHYIVWLSWIDHKINRETVNIYDRNHKYKIEKQYIDNKTTTSISIYETDLENRVFFSFKQKKLVIDQSLFDFANFNSDKALNRIKMIFTFQ
jgi:hypothetical protein